MLIRSSMNGMFVTCANGMRCPVLYRAISLVAAFLAVLAVPAGLAAADELRLKTLKRQVDPVVIRGEAVATLVGYPIENLGLFACNGAGGCLPIPFQIDEKLKGEYVFQSGEEAGEDTDHGCLDADDEIAFLTADSGAQVDPDRLPAEAATRVEITLIDPADGGRGFVYLLGFKGKASRSAIDYVRYDVENNVIETTDYRVSYDPAAPISIGWLSVRRGAGGSDQSVADRQKIRLEAVVKGSFLRFHRNEEHFRAEVTAYIDGSVRVLRRSRTWLLLVWKIPSPSIEMTSTYWKTGMYFPMRVQIPFRISRIFNRVQMRVYVDTPPQVVGRVFYNARNRNGVSIDGKMSQAEFDLDLRSSDWQVVAGTRPEHREGWFSRQMHQAEQTGIDMPLYYLDDMAIDDGPENMPGCFGCLGFELTGLEGMAAGETRVEVQMFPLVDYRPGDEKMYLDILNRPLKAEILVLPERFRSRF